MKKLLMVFLIVLVSGCGTFHATTQVADVAYLQIVGDPADVSMTLDNNAPINLQHDAKSFDLDGKTVTKFNLTPGTHIVRLERNGGLVANKKIYVSSGNVYEVVLP